MLADWFKQMAEAVETMVMVGNGFTEMGTMAVFTQVPSEADTVKVVDTAGLTIACELLPPYGVQV